MYLISLINQQPSQESHLTNISLQAELLSIQVGTPSTVGHKDAVDPMDQRWTTGFFKTSVKDPIWVGCTNLEGDGQADLKNHGGPEKAINAYPHEHYSYWEETLGLQTLSHGAFGENFTLTGALEDDVCIGDTFEIGNACIQVSQPRQPCWKLARRWRIKDLAFRVQETGRTGWYFRVLKEGMVKPGTQLTLIERPYPQWTVSAANDVMHHHMSDMESVRSLMECRLLSTRWKETLATRLATGTIKSNSDRLYGPG